MKVQITLEDTPKGITMSALHFPNGTVDHIPDSLSCIVTAAFASQLILQGNKGTLKVDVPSLRRLA